MKVVTIHQPEHFPYEGFFQKMKNADLFVILDNVKFRKNYFQNRNKFLNKQGVDEWFGVPVSKKSTSLHIKDVVPVDTLKWRRKVNQKIMNNLNVDVTKIYNHEKLIDINMASIDWCRKMLDINTPMVYASSLNVKGEKSGLLLDICLKTGADIYLSGPSGKDYLDGNLFQKNGLKVNFFEPDVKNYYSMLYNIARG